MPAVLTFWWLPDEEQAFLDFLASTGPVLAVSFQGVRDPKELTPVPITEYIKDNDPRQLFFGLEQHMASLIIAEYTSPVDGLQYSRVWDSRSCVIGYDRGYMIDSSRLTASNLYSYLDRPNESESAMEAKDPGFVMWAKKVFTWVRKATPEWHQYRHYRVTPRVNAAILNEGLQLASY